jgi:hypothetical protein
MVIDMNSNTIKISGLFEFEITMPDGASFSMSGNIGDEAGQAASGTPERTEPAQTLPANQNDADKGVFPKTLNGRIAEKVAVFIKGAGPDGVSRMQITRKFGQIKNQPQRESILRLLPDLIYRKSTERSGESGKPIEMWRYFYT